MALNHLNELLTVPRWLWSMLIKGMSTAIYRCILNYQVIQKSVGPRVVAGTGRWWQPAAAVTIAAITMDFLAHHVHNNKKNGVTRINNVIRTLPDRKTVHQSTAGLLSRRNSNCRRKFSPARRLRRIPSLAHLYTTSLQQ